VRSRAAELPVIDHEGGRQAEECLNRQECNLPAFPNGTAGKNLPELPARERDRQVEVVIEVSHGFPDLALTGGGLVPNEVLIVETSGRGRWLTSPMFIVGVAEVQWIKDAGLRRGYRA
jgi:hypothetical protein